MEYSRIQNQAKTNHQTISNTKLNIKAIKSNLSKFDIICLHETSAKEESLTFQDYTVHSTVRNSKSKRGQASFKTIAGLNTFKSLRFKGLSDTKYVTVRYTDHQC